MIDSTPTASGAVVDERPARPSQPMHLGALIKMDIASIPGVAKLETLLVLTEVKADAGWPAIGVED